MTQEPALPRTADVLIIGGGIVGLSIAFHLAERGAGRVVVVEQAEVASGATAHATGGIRQQFTTEAKVRLSIESVRFYESFAERVGRPFAFRRAGYLFLLPTEQQLAAFRRGVALQNRLGVPSEIVGADEVARRHPMIDVSGYLGASFCPTDGFGSPADAAYGLAGRARELGARIVEHVAVVAIETAGGRVSGVRTTAGAIAAPVVVNAAGPWAAAVGRMLDCPLPVTAHRRQVFTLSPVPALAAGFPLTIDMASGVYVHQEPGTLLLGGGDRDAAGGDDTRLDWSRFEGVAEAALRWLPALAEAESRSGWCGLREMTPDDHPILGPAPVVDGFWLAVGFSGHGFMLAPAVGRALADWLLTGQPVGIDPAPFALDRFASGRTAVDAAVF